MDKPVPFTWRSLLISMALILIPIIMSIAGAGYYFKGVVDTKMEYFDIELSKKVDNSVLMGYMEKSRELQLLRDKLLISHITSHEADTKEIREDINRINEELKDIYKRSNPDTYRGGKKEVSYLQLQNWLWEQGEWD